MLDNYRQMVYLNDLNDDEFGVFSTDVAEVVEENYPVYTTFVAMPSVNDTVDMWVVTTIVDDIDEDAHNMRHIYPYHALVDNGILPAKLSEKEIRAFYKCFAKKVDNYFNGIEPFLYAIISNNVEPNIITTMQLQCANSLFGWTLVVDTEEIVTE